MRLDDSELAMAHRLSEAQDEPIARLVRKWIRQHHEASFGATVVTPTPTPTPTTTTARARR